MSKGRIVFLNGASSSGKSSIAKVLQEMLEEPCVHLCIDDYLSAFQKGLWDKQEIVQARWPSIIAGFHAAAAAIAHAGNLVVVDDVLEEEAVMLECNLDDMNPERYSHVMDLLFAAGAADVFITPLVMKKSRPGHMLSVLCNPDTVGNMKEILFRESSSIGLREHGLKKSILRREIVLVHTRYGDVEVKRSFWNGRVVNEKPEFEQCRKLALEHGLSLEEISKEISKNL